ncbi:UNVERIFIED_CONTAM: hypothetical protein FKN15_059145 [Acipenser sinensis]
MVSILDYSISADDDLFVISLEPRSTQPVQPALPGPTPRQLQYAAFTTPNFSAQMSASPVCHGSRMATHSSATPDIRDWMISRLQLYLRSNNIPFKSTAQGTVVKYLSCCWYGNGAGAAPLPQLGANLGLHEGEARWPIVVGSHGGLGPGTHGGSGVGGERGEGRLFRRAGADSIPVRAETRESL